MQVGATGPELIRPAGDLQGTHAGQPALVIGGGPSAKQHVHEWPADAVIVSANEHGCRIATCEYIVALDPNPIMTVGPLVVTRDAHGFGDYALPPDDIADLGYSGVVATWFAWLLGCGPVYITGMDCYQGEAYFHQAGDHKQKRRPLNKHQKIWRKLLARCPGIEVRVLGGPLGEVFG